MNHQPFERWIYQEADLDKDQTNKLEEHLKTCRGCRELRQNMRNVSHLFTASSPPRPQPGFTERWKHRLKEREKNQRVKFTGITLGIIIASTFLLISSVGGQLPSIMDSLPQVLFHSVTQFVNWLFFINQVTRILEPIIQVGIKLIPPAWYFVFAIGFSGVLIAWLFSISESLVFIRRYSDEKTQ
jgi:hypothetical protein